MQRSKRTRSYSGQQPLKTSRSARGNGWRVRAGSASFGPRVAQLSARKGTRFRGIHLRIRQLTRDDVIGVNGLSTLTIERTIADLVELRTDMSLVAGVVRDAVRADKLIAPDLLASYLSPIAARHRSDGRTLTNDLFELAGLDLSQMAWADRATWAS